MKIIAFLIAILLVQKSHSQSIEREKKVIDSIVKHIDKNQKNAISSFKIQALKKVLHYINYTYLTNKSTIVKIDRRFKHKDDSVIHVFYFNKNKLIYATESIVTYYEEKNIKDTIVWHGSYYFSKNKIIDLSTLGHGKSESDNPNSWDPQREMLKYCSDAKRDIQRNKAKGKNGG